MTASMLRAVEPARDALLDRLPDPSQVGLPSLDVLGRHADETVDRWRGRPRRPGWMWLLGAVVIAGLAIAAASLAMTWSRSRGEPGHDDAIEHLDEMSGSGSLDGPDLGAAVDLPPARGSMTGLTADEGSLLSYDPMEGREA